MPRELRVFAEVEALDCRCGVTPGAEMWSGDYSGAAGAAIGCPSCHARIVELNSDPLEALRLAGIRWNESVKEAAVASDRRIQLPDVAPVSGTDTESGANVSQGVTAGRDRHRRPEGQSGGSGAASHQGRGGSPDEALGLENKTPVQASTPTEAHDDGQCCARQPDEPGHRSDRAFIELELFLAFGLNRLEEARKAVSEATAERSAAITKTRLAEELRDAWYMALAAVERLMAKTK